MTRIRIWHNRQRYQVEIEDQKMSIKRRGLLFNWNPTTNEREAIARILAQVLKEVWPHALRDEVIATLTGRIS